MMKASLKCITTKQSVSIWSVCLSTLILMYSVLSVAKAIKTDLSFGISVCISIDSSNDLRFVSIHLQCFHNRLISHFSSYCYILHANCGEIDFISNPWRFHCLSCEIRYRLAWLLFCRRSWTIPKWLRYLNESAITAHFRSTLTILSVI